MTNITFFARNNYTNITFLVGEKMKQNHIIGENYDEIYNGCLSNWI